MKSFKNYLRQQLHENQDSDSYAKYGMPDKVDVIVNSGKGYDENVKGNPATKYLSFISSRDTDKDNDGYVDEPKPQQLNESER